MDKVHYAMLEVMLNRCGAVTELTAVTRKGIQSEMSMNVGTLYRRLGELADEGYILKGLKDAREHTYYVTEHGKQALKEAKNEE